jgi:riboflavin kinase/FMN adenylyltransferase
VYAAWARLRPEPAIASVLSPYIENGGGEQHRAVVNIGTRPTFDNGPRTIEAHLVGFERDIYGQRLKLDFVTRLRPEERFDGVEELVAQIDRDVERALQLLHKVRIPD